MQTIPKIGLVNAVATPPRPVNMLTMIINEEFHMSSRHMMIYMCVYTMEELIYSRAGIAKRHLKAYDAALEELQEQRAH
jgi:hypothetical protein